MTIVALHPVVIHLERIGICLLAIDEDVALVSDLQRVALIDSDATLIDGQIVEIQGYRRTLGRNPDGTIVIHRPTLVTIQGIDDIGFRRLIYLEAIHQVRTRLHSLLHLLCQRANACLIQIAQVAEREVNLTNEIVGQTSTQGHLIVVLNIVGFLVCHPVEIDDAILDLQCLTGQSHTTLHVILTAVNRAPAHLTKLLRIVLDVLVSKGIVLVILLTKRKRIATVRRKSPEVLLIDLLAIDVAKHIVVGRLIARTESYAVACRIVEDNNIVELHGFRRNALVFPLRPRDVTLNASYGQGMLAKRHGKRGHRGTGTISRLRHIKVVAHEQTLL